LDVVPQQWAEIIDAYEKLVPMDAYTHWDELSRQPERYGISHEAWWAALKLARSSRLRFTPLADRTGRIFRFCVPDVLNEMLHHLDHGSAEATVDLELADCLAAGALREESIASATLSGEARSGENAKEMLRTGRDPKDEGEEAVSSLHRALESIETLRDEPLSPGKVITLHRHITGGKEDVPESVRPAPAGPLAEDSTRAGLGEPPSLEARAQCLESMCAFANGQTPDFFVHPLIRAVILHFWMLHVCPFPDGNSRTARALFRWAMLHQGYPLFAFVAISPVLLHAPARYARAVQQVESDDNDLTYFILHQAGVICEALKVLRERIARKKAERQETSAKLRGFAALNPRQQAVMVHALRAPDTHYLIAGHQRSHRVTHQTARDDLFDLAGRELLAVGKAGRRYVFTVPPDLARRLQAAGGRRRVAEVSLSNELPTNLL
jgi:Fic family protein